MEWDRVLGTTWVVLEYAIKIVALGTVPENRRPSSSTAWLLLIFLLPVVGLPLYLLLGSPWVRGRRQEQQEIVNNATLRYTRGLPTAPQGARPPGVLRSVLEMNRNLTGFPCVTGEVIQLHEDSAETYRLMARAIDQAQDHVHVEFYIQSWDEVTDVFYSALQRAAARGVAVRLLLDHLGSRKYPGWHGLGRRLDAAGIQWRLTMPLLPLHRRWRRPDLRNHRKLLIIDGHRAFIGSHNIIDPTYRLRSNVRAGRRWTDLSVEVTGEIVLEAEAVFAMDWYFEADEELEVLDPDSGAPALADAAARSATASSTASSTPSSPASGAASGAVARPASGAAWGTAPGAVTSAAPGAAATRSHRSGSMRAARRETTTLVATVPSEPGLSGGEGLGGAGRVVGTSSPQRGRPDAVVNAMQLVPSGPGYPTEPNLKMFLALIHNATRRVSITSPYFIPDEALLSAITSAAYRGVEVELFVGKESDHLIVNHAQRSYYGALLSAGVRIFRYPAPAVLHSKYMTVDDEVAVIGSSNMDFRSFALNYEVMLLAFGGDLDDLLRDKDEDYRRRSQELTAQEWAKEPWHRRYIDNVFRLLSSVL